MARDYLLQKKYAEVRHTCWVVNTYLSAIEYLKMREQELCYLQSMSSQCLYYKWYTCIAVKQCHLLDVVIFASVVMDHYQCYIFN